MRSFTTWHFHYILQNIAQMLRGRSSQWLVQSIELYIRSFSPWTVDHAIAQMTYKCLLWISRKYIMRGWSWMICVTKYFGMNQVMDSDFRNSMRHLFSINSKPPKLTLTCIFEREYLAFVINVFAMLVKCKDVLGISWYAIKITSIRPTIEWDIFRH